MLIAYRLARPEKALPDWEGATARPTAAYTAKEAEDGEEVWSGWTPVREVLECLEKTYGTSAGSAIGGVPTVGRSGWLPVADALRCMERQSLREALSR